MTGLPSFHYIREKVPIRAVAVELGLDVRNTTIRCWHPENHNNRDHNPSVGIKETKNYVHCFVCPDAKCLWPIDLVIDVNKDFHCLPKNQQVRESGLWIADRFKVPFIPKVNPKKKPADESWELGLTEDPLKLLVQSGLFASLSLPARSLAIALHALRSQKCRDHMAREWEVKASYHTLRKFSGIKSDSNIASALRELEEIGYCHREPSHPEHSTGPIKRSSVILVTPFSYDLMQLAKDNHASLQQASEAEMDMRRDRRRERQNEWQRKSRRLKKIATS
ncbi:MAG: hypothetical protein CMN58_04545 [Solibacterales bacterium]|nr:hypothetical protein [Bryobacterales bacterium]|tara:strand:+ start:1644 stop:2480 length:837 start_codon:yes stop_codon:yes gene_type:complete